MLGSIKKMLGIRPDYKDIREAYDAGDYEFVFTYYSLLAKRDDASGTHVLATLYKNGVGTQVSASKYRELIKKAAELGHIEATWEYIQLLMDESLDENAEEIERLLVRIGESGDDSSVIAWRSLGRKFSNGSGVPVNGAKALAYYQKAAELGDSEGLNSMACLLRDGDIVEKNARLAADYFAIGVEKLNDADSQIFLGVMYKDGEGVPKSVDKAIELFSLAAEQGRSLAMQLLSQIYRDDATKKNLVLAYKWLNLAAMEIDYLREHRDLLEQEMSVEQLSLAQQLCSEWHASHQSA